MGQSRYFMQNMQLFQGRQDSGRGKNAYEKILENNIIKYLIDKKKDFYISNDVYCYVENPDLDVDLNILRLVFGSFKRIEVNRFGFHISYSD